MTQTQLLNKWVKLYSDPTVPEEIIDEKVTELEKLHNEGKFVFNMESVYNNLNHIIRVKNPVDCIGEMEAEMDDNSGEEMEVLE